MTYNIIKTTDGARNSKIYQVEVETNRYIDFKGTATTTQDEINTMVEDFLNLEKEELERIEKQDKFYLEQYIPDEVKS